MANGRGRGNPIGPDLFVPASVLCSTYKFIRRFD